MATNTYTKRSYARDQFTIDSILFLFGVFLITYQFWIGTIVILASIAKVAKSVIDIIHF